MMGWDAWCTVALLGGVVALLLFTNLSADIVFWGGVIILMYLGILSPDEALLGLSSQGLVMIAALFVVVAGLRETGVVRWLVQRVLGRPASLRAAQARLMAPVTLASAFINNTPVVSMLIPAVTDWSRLNRLPASKLMIPMSYAAILGGTCSLIGTSTNIIVNDRLAATGQDGMGMFEIAWVGLPTAILGVAYILLLGRRLLPDRRPILSQLADPKKYTVEMRVPKGSSLVGKTIEQAGLRHLPGMFLIEIEREDFVIPAVGPQEVLRGGDRLVFAGVVDSVVDLQKIRGLEPAAGQVFKLDSPRPDRCLIEAVVSDRCPLVGRSIREGRFREVYNAVVIAVARQGERIDKKLGDIVLQPGDTLLLEAHPSFAEQWRNAYDFFLVSQLEDSNPPRHERAWLAGSIFVLMVVAMTSGWYPPVLCAMTAAGLMMATRCASRAGARRSIDLRVLLVIGASFAFGTALDDDHTGAASVIAQAIAEVATDQPQIALLAIYLATMFLTELITNNAAALLMFPIAMATAANFDAQPMAFIVAVMMAASASFSTPIGYQTNLMVFGPGGYKFFDYIKIGVPLNVLSCLLTVTLAPLIWPF